MPRTIRRTFFFIAVKASSEWNGVYDLLKAAQNFDRLYSTAKIFFYETFFFQDGQRNCCIVVAKNKARGIGGGDESSGGAGADGISEALSQHGGETIISGLR